MKIALGCDHGGFLLKEEVKKHLSDRGLEFEDFGCYSTESCDYPDMAERPCAAVLDGSCDFALLFCGTGIGISIAANKHRGIRAACCSDCFSARATRLHNNANVLCMGGRVVGPAWPSRWWMNFSPPPLKGDATSAASTSSPLWSGRSFHPVTFIREEI